MKQYVISLLTHFDAQVQNFFLNHRSSGLLNVALALSFFGRFYTVIILAAFVILLFWQQQQKIFILPFLLTIGGSSLTSFCLKFLTQRVRPLGSGYNEPFPSFPSGHATIAIALGGFLVYYLAQTLSPSLFKTIILVCLVLLILGIGLSRLYLGVHYLSDVVVGYGIGGIWLLLGIYLSR